MPPAKHSKKVHNHFWWNLPFGIAHKLVCVLQEHTRTLFFVYMKHNSRNLEWRTIAPCTWTASLVILWLCVFPAFVLSVTCKAEASCCRRLPARDHPGFCWDLQDAFFLMWLNRPKVGLTICSAKTSSDEIRLTSGIHIIHERLIISSRLCIIIETDALYIFYSRILFSNLECVLYFWLGA